VASVGTMAPAMADRPPGWFPVAWIALFVVPVIVKASIWPDRCPGCEEWGPMLVSAVGTALLLRPYVPRPRVWAINTVLGVAIGSVAALMAAGPFIVGAPGGVVGVPLIIGVLGAVTGSMQAAAFVPKGGRILASPRARRWIAVAVASWYAAVLAPALIPFYALRDFNWILLTAAAFAAGSVSGLGMFWILRRIPEPPGEAVIPPPPAGGTRGSAP
jgi:hypothetical protein